MTAVKRSVRRGLPRVSGGPSWPPVAEVEFHEPSSPVEAAHSSEARSLSADEISRIDALQVASSPLAAASESAGRIRQGLPRTAGGPGWPAAATMACSAESVSDVAAPDVPAPDVVAPRVPALGAPEPGGVAAGTALRRGLARVAGGDPWPPAGLSPSPTGKLAVRDAVSEAEPAASSAEDAVESRVVPVPPPVDKRPAAALAPLSPERTAWQGVAARTVSVAGAPASGPMRRLAESAGWTRLLAAAAGAVVLLVLAAAAVFAVRALLSMDVMQEWLVRYPGEYHLPEAATEGLPAWVRWQHFFNAFFMVLIIRTGLQVRTDKRPAAYWTPRWAKDSEGKISLSLWLHQSLDVLWLLNGAIFVVLLFATNHWMRIVPTSWDVFPNALSAILQYVSLNWPTENGWVNYNSLQQLMYFVTVFIAAPLAAITGVRMSGLWPKRAKTLSSIYPVELARALHFPVMLYFVVFIITHVALVFATGALRNLNHIYSGTDVVNWAGFWIFVASVVAIIAAWIAARPLVLTPIASLIGRVSAR